MNEVRDDGDSSGGRRICVKLRYLRCCISTGSLVFSVEHLSVYIYPYHEITRCLSSFNHGKLVSSTVLTRSSLDRRIPTSMIRKYACTRFNGYIEIPGLSGWNFNCLKALCIIAYRLHSRTLVIFKLSHVLLPYLWVWYISLRISKQP